jgi:hypothetical protein
MTRLLFDGVDEWARSRILGTAERVTGARRILVPRALAWFVVAGIVSTISDPASVVADPYLSWTAGPGAAGDGSVYNGFIDTPTAYATVPNGSFVVSGWFVDTTAQGWAGADDVQIFQGNMGEGGSMLADASIAQSRPDVANALGNPYYANSGFSATIPNGLLSLGAQTVSVYAHTPGNGWWYKQVPVQVSGSAGLATQNTPAAVASAVVVPSPTPTPPIVIVPTPTSPPVVLPVPPSQGTCSGNIATLTFRNSTEYPLTITVAGQSSQTVTASSGTVVSIPAPLSGNPPRGHYNININAVVPSGSNVVVAPLAGSWDLSNCTYPSEITLS